MRLSNFLRLSTLIPALGSVILLAYSALPSSTAFACLPCECPTERSVNCFGPYALYTPPDPRGGCAIDIWLVGEDGRGQRAFMLTNSQLAKVHDPTAEEHHVTIKTEFNGYVSLYKLYTGEYQINVGPTAEGKTYVIDFVGCPAEDVHESNYVAGQPPVELTTEPAS